MFADVVLNQDADRHLGAASCQTALRRTVGLKIQSPNEVACVGLITFAEMGSSHKSALCAVLGR